MQRITNLCDPNTLPDHEVVTYNGLEGELVVCVQRAGIVLIRITVAPHGPPQVMVADPPERRR